MLYALKLDPWKYIAFNLFGMIPETLLTYSIEYLDLQN